MFCVTYSQQVDTQVTFDSKFGARISSARKKHSQFHEMQKRNRTDNIRTYLNIHMLSISSHHTRDHVSPTSSSSSALAYPPHNNFHTPDASNIYRHLSFLLLPYTPSPNRLSDPVPFLFSPSLVPAPQISPYWLVYHSLNRALNRWAPNLSTNNIEAYQRHMKNRCGEGHVCA